MVELLTIHGPVRDPYLSEFSAGYDLDSGCSVESTLLLHLAVVLTTDARLHNNISVFVCLYVFVCVCVCVCVCVWC